MAVDSDGGQREHDDPLEELSNGGGGGRKGLLWLAGLTIAVLSVVAGFVIGARGHVQRPVADAASSSSTRSTAEAAPAASASATGMSAPPSESSAPEAVEGYAGLLAAVNANGDIVLVDADTAVAVRTLVRSDGVANESSQDRKPAWDADSGVVYFTRAGCSVWRYRIGHAVPEVMTQGRKVAVSPDGSRLAVWTCSPDPGRLEIFDVNTRALALSIPVSTAPMDQGGGMWYIGDIDWRPDGNALVVIAGWEGDDGRFLVDLLKPPRSVTEAEQVPVTSAFPETYHEVEYVGQRLVMSGTCCSLGSTTSSRVVVRDGRNGALTSLVHSALPENIEVSADARGRLRYLRHDSDRPEPLWALDRLDGVPREIGGEFIAIDW